MHYKIGLRWFNFLIAWLIKINVLIYLLMNLLIFILAKLAVIFDFELMHWSIINSSCDLMMYWMIGWWINWLEGWLIDWLIDLLTNWINWLTDKKIHWLIDWLIAYFRWSWWSHIRPDRWNLRLFALVLGSKSSYPHIIPGIRL